MRNYNRIVFFALMLSCAIGSACAADRFAVCAKSYADNDAERLKCFDKLLADNPLPQAEGVIKQDVIAVDAISAASKRSYLTRVWNLDNRTRRDSSSLDRLQPHKPSYLIIRETSRTNTQPSSPAPGHTALMPYTIDPMEAKFQLSFKTDIGALENLDLFGLKTVRAWGAYTQQSQWQVFNALNSSPFRETNYEPELIATFGTGNESGWKLLNLGFVHQSNGRTNPGSRSWNRIYAQGGWEWDNFSVLGRGWWRIPENALQDDNPDITHYIGRADMVARWEPDSKSQSISLLLRNNLNLKSNIGLVQLDWSAPIALGHAGRLHTQFSTGYGESLIDYNHRQTTLGIGVSFREW